MEKNCCLGCGARQSCLLVSQLSLEEIEASKGIRHIHGYEARQTLYHEGTPALGIHILCSGRVKLSRGDNHGRQQILRIVGPGEICGEEALLEEAAYTNTAEALESCQTAFVRRDAFLDLLENRNRILPLLRHICQVLVETRMRFTHVALGDARTRMAAQLLDLAERYGTATARGIITLDLPLRRSELAALVGLSPETAVRLLSQFQRDGLLEVKGQRLILKSPERLRALL